ncbi:MAG: glucokinase [Clostridia bacterium]|jgi:glucokinase|nr:glucokinase [Clostridia bacterium]MDN5324243.1 glucokinase [Clostridia bacterium]
MENKYILGIDVGGTNIKAGLVDYRGEIKDFQSMPTHKEKGPVCILNSIIELIRSYQNKVLLTGIGIALPGSVNSQTGTCLYSPNLKWENIQISQRIKEATDLNVEIINDANAACLGEYFFGAGNKCGSLICLTIGTGIGSGFILDQKLFVGSSGFAPEAGHLVIKSDGPFCSCGGQGCLESFVSAPAIVRRTREKIERGTPTSLTSIENVNLEELTIKQIFEAAQLEDHLAKEIIMETKEYLSIGLANLVNIFNPQQIILGGGVIDIGNAILDGLEEKVKQSIYPTLRDPLKIENAMLGNQAGVVGAASLLLRPIKFIGMK